MSIKESMSEYVKNIHNYFDIIEVDNRSTHNMFYVIYDVYKHNGSLTIITFKTLKEVIVLDYCDDMCTMKAVKSYRDLCLYFENIFKPTENEKTLANMVGGSVDSYVKIIEKISK